MAQVSADLELTIDSALAKVDELEARLAKATEAVAVEMTAEVDTGKAEAELADLGGEVSVPVSANTAPAEDEISDLSGIDLELLASIDTSGIPAAVDAAVSSLGAVEIPITADTTAAQQNVGDLGDAVDDVGTRSTTVLTGAGAAASGFGGGLRSVAQQAGAAKLGVAALGASVLLTGLNYNRLVQSARAAFTTLLGSAEAANEMLEQITAFGRTSPFPRQVLIDATRQLLAFGFAAEDVIPTLGAVQDSVAALGGGTWEINQIVNVLAQIQAQGRVTAEDINRLAIVGINGFQLLGDAAGRTALEMRDEVSKGAVDAGFAIEALVDGMNEQFGGAAENLRSTFDGAFDRLKGAARDVGSVLLEPFVSVEGGGALVELMNSTADALRTLIPLLEDVGAAVGDVLGGALAVVVPVLDAFLRGVGGIADAIGLIPGPVLTVVAALGALVAAARASLTAMLLLAANPTVGWLIVAAGAVTALGAALGLMGNQADDTTTRLYLTADALERIQREGRSLGEVLATRGQTGLVEDVLERIADISPSVVRAMNETETSVADLVSAIQSGAVPVDLFEPLIEAAGLTGEEAEDARAALAALGLQIAQAESAADAFTEAEEANAEALGMTAEEAAAAEQALESLVTQSTGHLPSLADAIRRTEEQMDAFGQSMTANTDPQLVIDNLFAMVQAFSDFGDNIAILAEQDLPLTVAALSALGPEVAGTFAEALVNAPDETRRNLELVLAVAEAEGLELGDILRGTFGTAAESGAGAIADKSGSFRAAGEQLGSKTKEGMTAGAANWPSEIGGFADEAIGEATKRRGEARKAGDTLASGIEQGLEQGARGISAAGRKSVSTGISAVLGMRGDAHAAGRAVGQSFSSGIASGIESYVGSIRDAAAKAVNEAEAAARGAADAHSPSRVFARLGRDMADGIVVGLAERESAAAAAAARLVAVPQLGPGVRGAGAGGGVAYVTVNVDARGSRDPEAVGAAAESGVGRGLRSHQLRVARALAQP